MNICKYPVQKKRLFSSIAVTFVLIAALPGVFVSCASKGTAESVDNSKTTYEAPRVADADENQTEAKDSTVVAEPEAIKLPSASKPKSFFAKIDPEVVKGVEIGSAASITQAISQIRKSESELIESEKVLIYAASEIMRILWPSQKMTWSTYAIAEETPYTGALNSVKKGIYDTSTGNTDFLSTFLPTLVFLTPNITAGVQAQCEDGLLKSLGFCPESVAANYLTGVYYERSGAFAKAEPYLKKAYDGSRVFEILLEYAKVLSKNGK